MIIKKLNGMFHKHGRWLFAVITVIIIISFVGFMAPGQFGLEGLFGQGGVRVGTAFGKKVTYDDLAKQIRLLTVFQYLYFGGEQTSIQPEQAFVSHCFVEAAKRQGIAVSDREVAKMIRTSPALKTNGKFDQQKYLALSKLLRERGISDGDMADAFRTVMLQEKLRAVLGSAQVVTPDEAEQFYRTVNAAFKVAAVQFKATDFRGQVPQDAKKLREYFDRNRRAYMIPGKVHGIVAEFPWADYRAQAAKSVTAEDAAKYFAAHREQFEVKGKVPEFKSIEAKVRAACVEAKAQDLAKAAAYDFAEDAYNAMSDVTADKRADAVKAVLAKRQPKVIDTGMIQADTETIGGRKLPRMATSLFEAFQSANPVTEILSGDRGELVGLAIGGVAARPANLNEVAAQVQSDFVSAEAVLLARKAATALREKLVATTNPAARLQLMAAPGAGRASTFEFSTRAMPPAGLESAAFAAYNLEVGDVSPVVPTEDGALVSELVKRTPPDMKAFAGASVQFTALCLNSKVSSAIAAFQEDLLQHCRFDANALKRQR